MYKLVKLKKIANVTTGFPFKGETYSDEGIRVVRGENVTIGSLRWDSIKCWNQKFDQFEKYSLREGDVVIGMDGSRVGKNRARISATDLPLLLAQRVACLRSKELSDQNFIYYLIRNNRFEEFVFKIQTGSSIPHISQKQIEEFAVPFPPLNIQKNISALLLNLDSKIELNNRINRELEQMAKLLYDYWFVQFDFPFDFAQGKPYSPPSEGCPQDGVGNSPPTEGWLKAGVGIGKPYKSNGGKMVWNEELKREIPEAWKVENLSEVTSSIMRGISPKYLDEGGICVLNQKCIRDQEVKFEFSRRHDHELKSASSKLIQYGDVLVNSTGFGTLGRVAIVKWLQEQTTAVDSHITIVRCENESIKKLFLGYSMLMRQSEIEGLAEGSTGQTELSRVNLGQLKMVISPIELQSRFERFAEPLIQKMAVNESENQQLASLRDWLLPMLMNGQVTVGAKEKVNYEVTEGMDVAAEPGGNV